MLTLTIPPRRDPIARAILLAMAGAVIWSLTIDWPPQSAMDWPDLFDPIGQLQYAVVVLAFVVAWLAGTLRRIPRQISLSMMMPAPAIRIPLKNAQRFAVFKRDHYHCQICGTTAAQGAKLEVDHKLAVAHGGTNDPANLWTLCVRCNNGKSDSYL